MRTLLQITIFVLLFVLCGLIGKGQFDNKRIEALTAAAAFSQTTIDSNALSTSMQQFVTRYPSLDISISIFDPTSKQYYHFGDSAAYGAASIGKILTAVVYLHQVDAGKASLDQKIQGLKASQHLEKLVVESDNIAWIAFNDLLGRDNLQKFADALGLTSYSAADNTLTSNDMALLLGKFASGHLLSNTSSRLLLGYMQRASMRAYIVAGAPAGVSTYHKTGYLSDRLHDAAILQKDGKSFVLVIFSKSTGNYDFSKGAKLFGDITKEASRIFFKQ